MRAGVEVGIHLRPGLLDDNFVAMALGNLAAFDLGRRRGETLAWQVFRVDGSSSHHYRLLLHHPERHLDLGFKKELGEVLDGLSNESVEELRERLRAAEIAGLRPVALRKVKEEVDLWQDDFWSWLGGPMGPGPL